MPKDKKKKAPLRLCKCAECKQYTTIDKVSGSEIRGQYISRYHFNKHKSGIGKDVDMSDVEASAWQATLGAENDGATDSNILFDKHGSTSAQDRTGGDTDYAIDEDETQSGTSGQ